MLLRTENANGVSVLDVSGEVRASETCDLVAAVERSFAGGPRGVVLDLRRVTELSAQAVSALVALASVSRSWPRPSLLVCPPAGADLPGLSAHLDPEAALRHVDDRSAAPRERVQLPHGPAGPGRARQVVAECAQRFGLGSLRDDLALLVSEMVTNAVRHAAAPVVLEVEADGPTVVVAVGDGTPQPPQQRDADDDAEGGRGLLLVDLLSSEHGVRPDPPGKTVWAAVTLRP